MSILIKLYECMYMYVCMYVLYVCVYVCMYVYSGTSVKGQDTPYNGHLPYNGQCLLYQLNFPFMQYFSGLPTAHR